jgi:3-methyladenine DNA glycosylase/8-oxoguanine DNA glycosylase
MRALGDPDAFPASDLHLQRLLRGGDVEACRPFRAYAAFYLWCAPEPKEHRA